MNLYCWKNHKIRLIYLKISSTSLANSRAEMKLERILLNLKKKKNQAIIWPLKVSKKESSNRHPPNFFFVEKKAKKARQLDIFGVG